MKNKRFLLGIFSLCFMLLAASSAEAQRIRASASPQNGGTILIENDDDGTSDGPASVADLNGNDAGELVAMTADAAPGFVFVEWQEGGAVISAANPYEQFVDGNNHAYSAIFEEGGGLVSADVSQTTEFPGVGTGTILLENVTSGASDGPGDPVQVAYEGNQRVRLTATPATPAGNFVRWIGEDVPEGTARNNPLYVNVEEEEGAVRAYNFTALISNGDLDGDGMSDVWEIANGLDIENPDDAALDPDNDGLTNLQEFNMDIVGVNGNVYGAKTDPNNPDTDGDGMWDGWEAYWGLDPNDATGVNGADGNPDPDPDGLFPDGDRLWNVETGMPADLYTNIQEFNAFVVRNGDTAELSPDNFAAAIEASSTDPFNWDTDGDTLPDGWEVSYGLDPTSDQGDDGTDGNPDGDMLYGNEGVPVDPYRNIDEYNRWAQSDFNSGTINELGSTSPTDADTDGDGMPDGWEHSYGGIDTDGDGISDDWNPNPLAEDADGNLDGDFKYVEATGNCMGGPDRPFTNIQEFQISSQSLRGATTHPRDRDVDGDLLPDHWEVIYSYDPWNTDTDGNGTDDGDENPDGDYMADDGAGAIHNDVYLNEGFDPRTGYAAGYARIWQWLQYPQVSVPAPDTRPFTNVDEILGDSGETDTFVCTGRATSPRSNDTDGDGIHDGWEHYVDLNPLNADDGGAGGADDGLNNLQEFQCMALGNMPEGNTWLNKIWPTDPNNPDTDGDQISDGAEQTFIYESETGWNGYCYEGGGLNPCTVDTDGDHIPDGWEVTYAGTGLPETRNGMDGTFRDSTSEMTSEYNDYDGDGLENYQEYWCGAVYHWQETSNPLIDGEWFPGGGYGDYDPLDLFTGEPHEFDWHYFSDMVRGLQDQPDNGGFGVPFFFLEAKAYPTGLKWSTTDPLEWDTDEDSMGDYYEIYHGMNPLFGVIDVYASKFSPPGTVVLAQQPTTPDVRMYPFAAGSEFLDLDQDGLPNGDESLQPEKLSAPYYYHTDPSPMWMTDISYQLSFPNLYYSLISMIDMWYFSFDGYGVPPDYVYSFESNEGYDTDNDNLSDRQELVDSTSPGSTDPLSFESPIKRRALYLDGEAAARTFVPFSYGETPLENYTVETWVRPENAASGAYQVILERPIQIPSGNIMNPTPDIRVNFRIGLTPDGRPYVEYNGNGYNAIFVTAEAQTYVLQDNEWVHLTGVYDGENGELRLYANGNLVATTPSLERPANGYYQHDRIFGGPLVVGARENNPNSEVNGSFVVTDPTIVIGQPDLDRYFQGWVDEIRIWNGVRTQLQIRENMKERMRMSDIMNPDSANAFIMFLYTFDSLPDPDYAPVSPEGFAALTGRPNDGSYPGIPWWRTANDRSTVYDDYLYVPWIENVDTHVPVDPAYDSIYWTGASTSAVTTINTSISDTTVTNIEDGVTNVVTETVTNVTTNVTYEVNEAFKNSSNPYNFGYYTAPNRGMQEHPLTGGMSDTRFVSVFDDMLPLRGAVGDEDVPLWDEGGTGRDPFDTDGDGLPDYWEEMYGLDPLDATGENGQRGDPDLDGLDNYSEYQAGTDPQSADSNGSGLYDYFQTNSFGLTLGELYDDGDGMPNDWEESFNNSNLDPNNYDADKDADGDGWSNYAEYRGGSDPTDPEDYPTGGSISGTLRYFGSNNRLDGNVVEAARVNIYFTNHMDGVEWYGDATVEEQVVPFSLGKAPLADAYNHPVGEKAYFMSFLDVQGDGAYTADEPMGIAERNPFDFGWDDITGVNITMTDDKPGFIRTEWANTSDEYDLTISSVGTSDGSTAMQIKLRSDTSFLHEGHFYAKGLYDGLGNGSWRVVVRDDENNVIHTVNTNISVSTANAPVVRYPQGTTVSASSIDVAWQSSVNYPRFEVQVLNNNGTTVLKSVTTNVQQRAAATEYAYKLPWLTTDELTDGTYKWQVRGKTADGYTPWSSQGTFTVDLATPNAQYSTISGDISYIGKVTNGIFVVTAHKRESMLDDPVARVRIPNTSSSGVRFDAPFELKGLRKGTYYVKAFLDQDGVVADRFESRGMLSADENIYLPKEFNTPPDYANQTLYVQDVDYDNDRVADAWEIQNFDDITSYSGQDPFPGQPGFTVFDVFEMNHYYPWEDSDGDGVSDFHEAFTYGTSSSTADDYLNLDLRAMDSDGDGRSDAIEFALGTDPFNTANTNLPRRLFRIERLRIEDGELKVVYSFEEGVGALAKNIRAWVEMSDSISDWTNAEKGTEEPFSAGAQSIESATESVSEIGEGIMPDKKFFRVDWNFQ